MKLGDGGMSIIDGHQHMVKNGNFRFHFDQITQWKMDRKKLKKIGWAQSDNTKTTIPRYNFMFFYVSKMAVAIAFLCKNAVEAI